jgi:hypothetical protein
LKRNDQETPETGWQRARIISIEAAAKKAMAKLAMLTGLSLHHLRSRLHALQRRLARYPVGSQEHTEARQDVEDLKRAMKARIYKSLN